MRTMIVGAGEVGWSLAGRLSREGHEVVVLDQDRDLLVRRTRAGLDVRLERADAASPRDLAAQGAGDFDLFVAVTASDATNLLSCLLAREQGAGRTMARVRDADYYPEGEDTASGVLGIDLLVSPELAAVGDLESALRVRGAVRVESFADERLSLAECLVTDASPAARRAVSTRPHATHSKVGALLRDGRVHLATKDTTPLPGDHLVIVAPREQLKEACREIDPNARKVDRVAVFGAGLIGVGLAQRLAAHGREVVLLEPDERRARDAAEVLDDRAIQVLWEEGASEAAMREAGVDACDAFVSCAADDRATLLACTHADRLDVGLVLAVLSREEFAPLAEALGVDGIVAPRLAAAERIIRTSRGSGAQKSTLIADGLEALEYRIAPGTKLCGRPVAASLPHDTALTALVRRDDVLYPGQVDRYEPGDIALVLATGHGGQKLGAALEG
ncbi:Trk system potassium transporter TrkA [Patulibacter sp. SYSU D01012]|uniref:Trk system potassium transporter TrkA n=1 Tax=Patulibacter sp. SYSU D01012 TaxID=2817381 RepID=UPI001B3153A4|nr:Trk system potassium transporter TrkA [Patulibacter sp. SYSU D01012]